MKGIKLGRGGTYTSGDGFEKTALIIGTRESIKPGTNVVRPDEGHVNVLVFRPKKGSKDSTYERTNVKVGTGKQQFHR